MPDATVKPLERNLPLLRLLQVDVWILAAAVVVAYQMHAVGLTLSQVLMGEAVFAVTILVFEIPTGVFSDLVSRKTTLIIAEALTICGAFVFAFAESFTHILILQVLVGISCATLSGTDSAMLYDTLKALGREGEHRRILSSFTTFNLITLSIGTVLSSILGSISLRLPILIGFSIAVFRLIITLFLTEPPREQPVATSHPLLHAAGTLRWMRLHPLIPTLVLGNAFLALGFKVANHTYNPYMETVGIPLIAWGMILCGFNLTAAFLSHHAHTIQSRLGETASIACIFTLQAAGFLLMTASGAPPALFFPILIWISFPLRTVFFADAINRRTSSHHRATVLSMSSFCAQGLQAVSLPLFGLLVSRGNLSVLYLLLAGILVLSGVVVTGIFHRAKEGGETPIASPA
jgi:MFS family permease